MPPNRAVDGGVMEAVVLVAEAVVYEKTGLWVFWFKINIGKISISGRLTG